MSDYSETLKLIKQAALDAVNAAKPTAVCFGKVTSTSPLQINVEQKMTLGVAQLVLSRNVTNYKIPVTMNWACESSGASHSHVISGVTGKGGEPEHDHTLSSGNTGSSSIRHSHTISGDKEITIQNGLSVGEEVILMQMQGGQKYIVLDRVGRL